jgi:hypothetical protein
MKFDASCRVRMPHRFDALAMHTKPPQGGFFIGRLRERPLCHGGLQQGFLTLPLTALYDASPAALPLLLAVISRC